MTDEEFYKTFGKGLWQIHDYDYDAHTNEGDRALWNSLKPEKKISETKETPKPPEASGE